MIATEVAGLLGVGAETARGVREQVTGTRDRAHHRYPMRLVVWFVKALTYALDRIGAVIVRAQIVLSGTLPALLPPEELMRLLGDYYVRSYSNLAVESGSEELQWTLVPWEQYMVAKHMPQKGSVLVLGAGYGRESVAFALNGYRVVGLDTNRDALLVATRQAATENVEASFIQADFLALPLLPKQFDYILVSGLMFSSVSGTQRRQAWVRTLLASVRKEGTVVLNFATAREMHTKTRQFIQRINRWLVRLPGANREYQPGDSFLQGHFMHGFLDEQEMRAELTEAGALIIDIDWTNGVAVISSPDRPCQSADSK